MKTKLRIAIQTVTRTAVVLLVFLPIRLPLAVLHAILSGLAAGFERLSEGLDNGMDELRRIMLGWHIITRDDAWGKYEEGREAVSRLEALKRMNLAEKP